MYSRILELRMTKRRERRIQVGKPNLICKVGGAGGVSKGYLRRERRI